MKTEFCAKRTLEFLKRELKEYLLSFWMPRCLDEECGGYLNCFSNDGSRLVSKDKYLWSQGRFLWMFSKLALLKGDTFSREERELFLRYAKSGRDFMLRHALVAKDDYRCVFLTEQDGSPKGLEGYEGYDLSISADCFVVMGFSLYSRAAKDEESWLFAKRLGDSVWDRYRSDCYRSLPYPVPEGYQSHAKPMILTHLCCEMYRAALTFDPSYAEILRERIALCHREVFEIFRDEADLIHEFKYSDNTFAPNLFGQHINPGHTLEDLWFQWDAAEILGTAEAELDRIGRVAKATVELGWDPKFGGFLHFVPCDGLDTACDTAEEAQMKLVLDDWGSKLWWVHSEAMYTLLLMYAKTKDSYFKEWFERSFDYAFSVFPNPDRSVGEWIQIRTREGKPQEKVVALPVKDPYHIIRNVALMIELLESWEEAK